MSTGCGFAPPNRISGFQLAALGVLLASGVGPTVLAASGTAGEQVFRGERTEDRRTGEHYAGGTRLRAPLLGVSFVVPPEWRATLPAGAQVIHLDSFIEKILTHLSLWPYASHAPPPGAVA